MAPMRVESLARLRFGAPRTRCATVLHDAKEAELDGAWFGT